MDSDTAGYKQERYDEVASEMKNMLAKVGWKKEFIDESVPVLPISGWMGDNLIKPSDKMTWWKGVDVKGLSGETIHVHTLLDALNGFCVIPQRDTNANMRMPISGIYKIKGVGDVLTGRVEQGVVKCNEEVIFVPTHQPSTPALERYSPSRCTTRSSMRPSLVTTLDATSRVSSRRTCPTLVMS